MNKIENEEKKIVFNTPVGLNIAEAFPSFSMKDLAKIECLINQINFFNEGRGYEIHVKKHAWSYCLSNGEVTFILKTLVDLNIIKKCKENNPGVNSNGYVMVKPYTNDTSIKSYYRAEDHLFIRKLQADKWIAMGADHSKFVKTPVEADAVKPNKKSAKVKDLEARIIQLEDFIKTNGLSIPAAPIVEPEVEKSHMEAPALSPVHEDLSPEIPPETAIAPDTEVEEPDFENNIIYLTDQLSILPYQDTLVINYKDYDVYIDNYSYMENWVSRLDEAEKVRMFSTIAEDQKTGIIIPICKGKMKAHFIKMKDGYDTKVVYKSVVNS